MARNITQIPEKWTILKLYGNQYKVFATWSGGYLGRDRWLFNSGIASVDEDDDFYYFIGFSGSCYKCHKGAYGIANSYCRSILDNIMSQANGDPTLIEIMEGETDWKELIESGSGDSGSEEDI